ncbi:MAG: hypothetical protein QW290_08070 [Sulfolobales archaeon]
MSFLSDRTLEILAKELKIDEESKLKESVQQALDDIAEMLRRFVWSRQYSFADRLANAVSKEMISATLYEMLRIAKSVKDTGKTLDENIHPYVAREESIVLLLRLADVSLPEGLETVRRAAILAMGIRQKKEDKKED